MVRSLLAKASLAAKVAVAALPVAGFLLGGLAALPFAIALSAIERPQSRKDHDGRG